MVIENIIDHEKAGAKTFELNLKGISEELVMPISNWDHTQSDRDYNAYSFIYESVFGIDSEREEYIYAKDTLLGSIENGRVYNNYTLC